MVKKKNWDRDVFPHIEHGLNDFKNRGIKPTLRTIFYSLVSLDVIENTKSSYKQLSDYTVKKRERGLLPMNCFTDSSRNIIEDFDDRFVTLDSYLNIGIYYLRNASTDYLKSVPRWYKQPNYVEVWIEKEAMVGTFYSILRDRQIIIVPTRGFSSITFLHTNTKRLKEIQDTGRSIFIRYFGDFDPSGENIEDNIKNKLKRYGLSGIYFDRIAINETHISKFSLPKKPDERTMDKLNRDPRSNSFRKRHKGKLFQVELDALQAIAPDDFKTMIIESVDSLFDEGLYQNIKSSIAETDVTGLVQTKLQKLLDELR